MTDDIERNDMEQDAVAVLSERAGADQETAIGISQQNTVSGCEATSDMSADAGLIQSAVMLMPQDIATRQILDERARAIAKPANQQHELRSQYLRFRLGPVERYGIPYIYLEELLYIGNLARVPCTPTFVAGVVNHRGELLTILDLKQLFHMPASAVSDEARIIVVKHAGMRTGLLVDGVDGNEAYQEAELAPPLNAEGFTDRVLGIHQGSVALLNLTALLEDTALQVNR
jgi:purine-binding chemotaxis protein CheW